MPRHPAPPLSLCELCSWASLFPCLSSCPCYSTISLKQSSFLLTWGLPFLLDYSHQHSFFIHLEKNATTITSERPLSWPVFPFVFCPFLPSNKQQNFFESLFYKLILRSFIFFLLFSFAPSPVCPLCLISTAVVFVQLSRSPCTTSSGQLSCPSSSLLAAASDMAKLSFMTYLLHFL